MSGVWLKDISKSFGSFVAVQNINLQLRDGEFVTILGASGSGKTTCLRIIAGFVRPTSGRVVIGDRDVTALPPYRRNAGVVFQHYALFPHLSIEENVAFGLKIRKLPSTQVKEKTRQALCLVGLEGVAGRYPHELSGGQKQRIALARAVVTTPELLLLDEPLSALDFKLRKELRSEIKTMQKNLGITTLFVTHDQDEALTMSDRIVVMRDGRILQIDTPDALYRRPRTPYVANFVGQTNLFEATIVHRTADGCRHVLKLDRSDDLVVEVLGQQAEEFAEGEKCLVGFRPEDGRLGEFDENHLPVDLKKTEYVGDGWLLEGNGPGAQKVVVSLHARSDIPIVESRVTISWAAERSILLKADVTVLR